MAFYANGLLPQHLQNRREMLQNTHRMTGSVEKRWFGEKRREAKVYLSSPFSMLFTHSLWVIVFRVPTTHDVLTALFHPGYQKSHLDLLNLALIALQFLLFFRLSRETAQIFFLFYFAFWRATYDGGLGWVLTKQSKKRWIVREVQRLGWLDEKRRPAVRKWIRKQLADKMGKDYSFDVGLLFAQSYNTLLTSPPLKKGFAPRIQYLALVSSSCRCNSYQVIKLPFFIPVTRVTNILIFFFPQK